MSDLVKRLRTYHREVVELDDGECPATAMVRDAADEIERLRGALTKIAAYDPGRFRPLQDEIAIWKIATDALAGAADQPSSASGEGET